MIKNHKTTTLLVAIAAFAATLLAAGTVAALGSDHSAFAYKEYQKKYNKFNNEGKSVSDGNNINANKQIVKCIVVGRDDGMKRYDGERAAPITPVPTDETGDGIGPNSCYASNENTNNDGGNTMACTTITIPSTTINVTSASGGPLVPVDLHKDETLPCDLGKSILLTIGIGTPGIDVFVTFTPRPSTGVCPENSVPAVGNNGARFCASFETGV
jgi:hypothetical protein